jgi:hypothetical protein
MELFVADREECGPSTQNAAVHLDPEMRPQGQSANNLTLTQAEDLLDWLECHGIAPQDVHVDAEGRMSVRWRG